MEVYGSLWKFMELTCMWLERALSLDAEEILPLRFVNTTSMKLLCHKIAGTEQDLKDNPIDSA
jgi:hypothetical protein